MHNDDGWQIAPRTLKLAHDEVHVWRASLSRPTFVVEQLRQVLEPAEVTRVQRFYFEKDRQHWTVARGLLRTLLASYLAVNPREIAFGSNAYGKPVLEHPMSNPPLHFNISHSHEMALFAFTYGRHLGVDVEYMRAGIDYDGLAKHSFSQYENTTLRVLPAEAKHEAFFRCWTRKEAYIKARGMGLSLPLHLFDVELKANEPAALLASREDPQEVARWTLRELLPGTGYAGALTVEGRDWRLCSWQWSD